MKARHFDTLWLLLLGACTFEPGGSTGFGPDVVNTSGAGTTAAGSETGEDTDASSSSTTTTSVAETSAGSTSSAGTDTNGSTTSTTSAADETSGTSGPPCGDGNDDEGEECDDGNDDDFDECTSQCTVPVCSDGEHNGAETDIDCGGACQACAVCQTCVNASDCGGEMVCNAAAQCVTQFELDIDWRDNCPASAQGVTIPSVPAGTYRATATSSAGTLWDPPYTPPSTGFFYETTCSGVIFEEMLTPVGVRYANINTAFEAMTSDTEVFDYAGGDFTCWVDDGGCSDNGGSVAFSVESECER